MPLIPSDQIPARRGYIRVSLEILRDAIGLPRDMEIRDVLITPDDSFGHSVTLAVSGPQCPAVAPGARTPHLLVKLQREENGRVSMVSAEAFEPAQAEPPMASIEDVVARINRQLAEEGAQ